MVEDSASALADHDVGDAPSRVAPLSELDEFEIADGYPEVRGWEVRDAAGRAIGYVYDLLVDVEAMRVRYMDVCLDAEFAGGDADQRVLIPIESVSLDGSAEDVLLRGIDAAEVRALVPYARRGVAREREAAPVTEPADVLPPLPVADSELRRQPEYDDARRFGRDRPTTPTPPTPPAVPMTPAMPQQTGDVAAFGDVGMDELAPREITLGDVAIRRVVETERVREQVPVMREEIEIERRALRPGEEVRTSDTSSDEIRIPIMVEEVVVEKRLVAKEVLIIRKRAVTEQRTIETEVRREDVRIDDPLGRVRSIGPSGGREGRA